MKVELKTLLFAAVAALNACGGADNSIGTKKPSSSSAAPEDGAGTSLYVRHQLISAGGQRAKHLKLASVV